MKFSYVVILLVLSVCLFSSSDAIPKLRQKRTLAQEYCPNAMSAKECADYAEEESKKLEYCHRYYVSGNHIEWQSCGRAMCGKNTRLVEEDKSKPYPECCVHCEIIDPNKSAESSAIM
ncbi:uncharacterized protein LOC100114870 [Nasonia vitripennis]|uniref:Single domain-containing protein n=1 Tax=Nasonia vitripennis TaxID=7425 RepID=A0A7M7GAH8_NASVI|nr:uncharacterized protein LOC100114870 [Nasonia vitripennis]